MIIRSRESVSGLLKYKKYNETTIVYGANGLYIYDQAGCLKDTILDGVSIQNVLQNSTYLAVITKESVFIIEKDNTQDFTDIKKVDKENLDHVILTESQLYVIQRSNIISYSVPGMKLHSTTSQENGLCIGHVNEQDLLFLAFENGKINILERGSLETIKTYVDVKKMITTFDRTQFNMIIGTFCKQIIKLDYDGNMLKQIKIENHPIVIKILNDHVYVLDSENNLILLNSELELVHSKSYGGLLKTFNVIGRNVILIYTTGTIFIDNQLPQISCSTKRVLSDH